MSLAVGLSGGLEGGFPTLGRRLRVEHAVRWGGPAALTPGGLRLVSGTVEGLGPKWLLGTLRVAPGQIGVRSHRPSRPDWVDVPVSDFDVLQRHWTLAERLRLRFDSQVFVLHTRDEVIVEVCVSEDCATSILTSLFGTRLVRARLDRSA